MGEGNIRWVLGAMLAHVKYGKLSDGDILARVSFPPYRGDSDVRVILHGLFARNTGCVQHSLTSSSAGFI